MIPGREEPESMYKVLWLAFAEELDATSAVSTKVRSVILFVEARRIEVEAVLQILSCVPQSR